MAIAGKILGQSNPTAATLTTLYTVPSVTEANVNIYICNRSVTATTIRVALRPNGAAISNEHYILYDAPIAGNSVMNMTGIALDAADIVSVYATLATVSFNATGMETS